MRGLCRRGAQIGVTRRDRTFQEPQYAVDENFPTEINGEKLTNDTDWFGASS